MEVGSQGQRACLIVWCKGCCLVMAGTGLIGEATLQGKSSVRHRWCRIFKLCCGAARQSLPRPALPFVSLLRLLPQLANLRNEKRILAKRLGVKLATGADTASAGDEDEGAERSLGSETKR